MLVWISSKKDKQHYLILVDYYTSYPWIRKLSSISATTVINACKSVFNEYGYPVHLHSDSGSQFTAEIFTEYMRDNNVQHTLSSPYYHQSNGKAERYVKTIKSFLNKCDRSCTIGEALLIYRATPLSSNKASPGKLMFNRTINTRLVHTQIHDGKDQEQSIPVGKCPSKYMIDDKVFVFNSLTGIWDKGRVTSIGQQPDQYFVMLSNGKIYTRNSNHLKKDKSDNTVSVPDKPIDNDNSEVDIPTENNNDIDIQPNQIDIQPNAIDIHPNIVDEQPVEPVRRSTRNTQQPKYLKDYSL